MSGFRTRNEDSSGKLKPVQSLVALYGGSMSMIEVLAGICRNKARRLVACWSASTCYGFVVGHPNEAWLLYDGSELARQPCAQ